MEMSPPKKITMLKKGILKNSGFAPWFGTVPKCNGFSPDQNHILPLSFGVIRPVVFA